MTQRLSLAVLVPVLILVGSAIRSAVHRALPATIPPETTRAIALDVGQGDAILLDGPGDAEVLIDGGPSLDLPQQLRRELGDDRTIDLVVLTHPHADHLVGLTPVLDRYEVGRVLTTGVIHTTSEYEDFLTAIRDRHIPTTIAIAGQTYDIGPFHLEILHPFNDLSGTRVDNLNSSSIVMMTTVRFISPPLPEGEVEGASKTRILLTGDAEEDVERALLERYCPERIAPCPRLQADVLKAGHHGSQTSSTTPFLDAIRPLHALISAGVRNDYGHPHRRALKRLERIGAQIWRTDRQGNLTVTFAPQGLSVTAER